MIYKYSDPEIQRYVEICIGILLKKDLLLLENQAHERAISHKLAEYLQTKFQDLHVDCEYNRKGSDIKKVEGNNVLPDIIIHRRNSNENILVIEMKITNDDGHDIKRLKKFTSQNGELKYQLGLFLKLSDSCEEPILQWFKEGKKIPATLENR